MGWSTVQVVIMLVGWWVVGTFIIKDPMMVKVVEFGFPTTVRTNLTLSHTWCTTLLGYSVRTRRNHSLGDMKDIFRNVNEDFVHQV